MAATLKLQAKNEAKPGVKEFAKEVAQAEGAITKLETKAKDASKATQGLDKSKKSLSDTFKQAAGPMGGFLSNLGLSEASTLSATGALGKFGVAIGATLGNVVLWGKAWEQSSQNFRLAGAEAERNKDIMKGLDQQYSSTTQHIVQIGQSVVNSFKGFSAQIGLFKADMSALDEQLEKEANKAKGAQTNLELKQFSERRVAAGGAQATTRDATTQISLNAANAAAKEVDYRTRAVGLGMQLAKLKEEEVSKSRSHEDIMRDINRITAEIADNEQARVQMADRLRELGRALPDALKDMNDRQTIASTHAKDLFSILEDQNELMKKETLTQEQLAQLEKERSAVVGEIVRQQESARDLLKDIASASSLDTNKQVVKKLTLEQVTASLEAQKKMIEEQAKTEGITADEQKQFMAERAQLEARRDELLAEADAKEKEADQHKQEALEQQIAQTRELIQLEENSSTKNIQRTEELKAKEKELVALRKDKWKTEMEGNDAAHKKVVESIQKQKALQDEVLAKMREAMGQKDGAGGKGGALLEQIQRAANDPDKLRRQLIQNRLDSGMSRKEAFQSVNRDIKKGNVNDEELAKARADLGEQTLKSLEGTGKVSGETVATLRKMLQEQAKTMQVQDKLVSEFKELQAAVDALSKNRGQSSGGI